MVPEGESEDDRMLREREQTLKADRRKQAQWYESLNLYAEALKIYEDIHDTDNINRLREKMRGEYSLNAKKLEKQGRYQDAANLYYLIGDLNSVSRMKKLKPDLVILYDSEGGGLAKLASGLGSRDIEAEQDDYFERMNEEDEEGSSDEVSVKKSAEGVKEGISSGRKGIPVKMPKNRKKRFCPYCGEEITTRKEPRFCPYCGEDLN